MSTSAFTRAMSRVCENCPVCKRARKTQRGLAYKLVKRLDSKVCPFCLAYARVHGRKSYEPAT